jgi:hypothetical protein
LVRRLHAAAAADIVTPMSHARERLLPELGAAVLEPSMTKPLLRAGVLGAVRRILQTTGDTRLTKPELCERLRLSIFGVLRNLAPEVHSHHLEQSRGLGKLLMLIATSPSERRPIREAGRAVLLQITGEHRRSQEIAGDRAVPLQITSLTERPTAALVSAMRASVPAQQSRPHARLSHEPPPTATQPPPAKKVRLLVPPRTSDHHNATKREI